MRPLRLDLAGFAAFRDETSVDFTDADFFALVGPTGSGKSTVLDAICFALYGRVPRWGDARSVVSALAPSAAEARVRLTFEVAGARFVATRVVRRDGKGRVKTAGAGLQRMPNDFDIRRFDTGLTLDDLGTPLAGAPAAMEPMVREVVGLPYEQFVTCVVLPQGEFAEFLHAKPATRQQILVNLLGLSIYEQVRERASGRATRAEAELAATDRLLAELAGVDDAALAQAEAELAAAEQLAQAVEQALPELAAARSEQDRTAAELTARDEQLAQLAAVRPPAATAALAQAVAAARDTLATATAEVGADEEQEDRVRETLAAAGDAGSRKLLLAWHEERAELAAQQAELGKVVEQAEAEHATAAAAVTEARAQVEQATDALTAARAAYTQAQAADRAAALRTELVAGQPCPVCGQLVADLPAPPADSTLAQTEAMGKAARAAADAAQKLLSHREATARKLDRAVTAAQAQAEALAARLAELDARLAPAPGPEQLRDELDRITTAEAQLAEATSAAREARATQRQAQSELEAAERRLRAGWREFDTTRDALAAYRPPPSDRDDLATAWTALARWTAGQADMLRTGRPAAVAAVEQARQSVTTVQHRIEQLFQAAQLSVPDDSAYASAAAVAVERARSHLDQLRARREQANRLREQRARHEADTQVARALAQHLRANNFEAWLLEEALDHLVAGASTILRELSGGQYDLAHEDREFWVVDHHDAGLRRGVRTLSGGETFQASLALALALSEQLAGMSATSTSLESILLDEGFGSLDAATLDAVAATLETLAARGDRMVGVVTHVPTLAERIPVRFEVDKDARSARIIRIGP